MPITKNIYKVLLRYSEYSYDVKKVNRLIVLIKRSNNEAKNQQYKEQLFMLLSKIIVKAINNFFNLTKDVNPEKILHTREDICSECFLIMIKCVNACDISDLHKFYFYLNTSLNRGIYRIYEKNYKKHFDVLDNSDKTENLILNKSYNQHFNPIEIDLKGFSELEMDIIKFKMSGQKLNLFLKKINIPSSQYYLLYEGIVEKLKALYEDDKDYAKFFNQE